jgi:hypothetical protein
MMIIKYVLPSPGASSRQRCKPEITQLTRTASAVACFPLSAPPTRPTLQCGYEDGTDRLHLRLPVEVTHVIDDDSPLANWLEADGMARDADSEIVVVVSV